MTTRLFLILAVFCLMLSGGCGGKSASGDSGQVTHVKVTESGKIYINNNLSPLEDLIAECNRLKCEGGTVSYFREHPDYSPTTEQGEILKAVNATKVKVRIVKTEEASE